MKLKSILMVMILCTGFWQLSGSSYMLVKAWFSQYLIASAWNKTLEDQLHHKPWSWADTYPVAYMQIPRLMSKSYILSGSSGRNLAFSATHLSASGMPGDNMSTIISGHKDSHFDYLKDIEIGDLIHLTTLKSTFKYRVINIQIINSAHNQLNITNKEELVLTTCFPFDSLSFNGDLRYVVHALPIA